MEHTTQNDMRDTPLNIAGTSFSSRLLVGTGKYKNLDEAQTCIEASGAEIVTVALRRVDLSQDRPPMLQSKIDPERYIYLPNSAGCYSADEAIRTFRLARQIKGWNLIKLEVIGDKKTLYPDMIETLKAARVLVDDGFDVMVYCNDDPLIAKELEAIGCVAIMPLAAPIGSGMGLLNPQRISTIIEQSNVPVIVDAGLGTASDVAQAMELGCDGVLLNSAIAHAKNPLFMARAMRDAAKAGRQAFLAGRMPMKAYATASSPLEGMSVSKKIA